jgi:hypothetical protein
LLVKIAVLGGVSAMQCMQRCRVDAAVSRKCQRRVNSLSSLTAHLRHEV